MKKLLFIILAGSLIILIFIPLVWNWISDFTNTSESIEYSQLQFTSIEGDYLVFVDDRQVGRVENKNTKVFAKIESGERVIKIVRSSNQENLYFILERKINFSPRTQTEIVWSSGPTLESSEGVIKYFGSSSSPTGTRVILTTFPTFAKVKLNEREIGREFIVDNIETNKLIVSAGENYNSRELELRLKDDSTNTPPKNTSLNIEVYLYKRPF